MKILVTGRVIPSQPDRCTGQQLAEGFRQAGHECVFFGCYYGTPTSFLGAQEVYENDFDLVVVTEMNDGMRGYETLFAHYRLKNVPRVYWDFDVSYHPEQSLHRAEQYHPNGFLVANKHWPEEFKKRFNKPVLHLPYGCSPQIHRRMKDVEKQFVVGFVGSLNEERRSLLDMMKRAMSNPSLLDVKEGLYGDELIKRTNMYAVMLHLNQQACNGLVPGRPWETTSCGTTLLMDRVSFDDFKEFIPQQLYDDLFVYDNNNDILAWANKYAGWEKKNMELEMAGDSLMNYIQANHSYKCRAESIIEWSKSL